MSENRGDMWHMILDLSSRDIKLSPEFPMDSTVFVVTVAGIFKSTNGGKSWIQSDSGITSPYISSIAISPDFGKDLTLLATTDDCEGPFKSVDGGISWFPVNSGISMNGIPNLTKSPFVSDMLPTLLSEPDGTLHLAWFGTYIDETSYHQNIFYKKRTGYDWSELIEIQSPAGFYTTDFSMDVDVEGHPHFVFQSTNDDYFEGDNLYYTYETDNGLFCEPILVIDGKDPDSQDWNSEFRQLSLKVSGTGTAHFFYIGFYGTGRLWYTDNHTGGFTMPALVTPDVMNVQSFDTVIDYDDRLHVAVEIWDDGIYYINTISNGFSDPLSISDRTGKDPIMDIDSENAVHVVYYISTGKQIAYTENTSGIFESTQYFGSYHHPSMVVDKNGKAHIAMQKGPVPTNWLFFPINQIAYANNLDGLFKHEVVTELESGIPTAEGHYIALTPDDSVHIIYANGAYTDYDLFHLTLSSGHITSVKRKMSPVHGTTFDLSYNYPNPFNASTTIHYSLTKSTGVLLIIYNQLGQEIRTLIDDVQKAGRKQIIWDGFDNHGKIVNSGLYYYKLIVGTKSQTKKMVLIK